MGYNKLNSLMANIKAIQTAFRLRLNGSKATEKELNDLKGFSGFGGLKCALYIDKAKELWPASEQELFEPMQQLNQLLTEMSIGNKDTLKAMQDSIKNSVLTAFYTPTDFILTIKDILHQSFNQQGLSISRLLEPSAGIGGFLPLALPNTERIAFEKDVISVLVLSALNDTTKSFMSGFETIDTQPIDNKPFDIITSNIPFGNIKVFDATFEKEGGVFAQACKTVHNYFIFKAIEQLKEGGLIIFITSQGIADATNNRFVRDYIVNNTNLITAIRLPQNFFSETSGIEVGSDFYILQKKSNKALLTSREQLYKEVEKCTIPNIGKSEATNKLLSASQNMLATHIQFQSNQFGKFNKVGHWNEDKAQMYVKLQELVAKNFQNYFQAKLYQGTNQPIMPTSLFDLMEVEAEPIIKDLGNRSYTDELKEWMKNGTLVIFETQLGKLRITKNILNETFITFTHVEQNLLNLQRAADYFKLRESYYALSSYEENTREEHPLFREQLNKHYDAFTSKWGILHKKENKDFLALDTHGFEILSLEIKQAGDYLKADILREPVAFTKIDRNVKLTPNEALASSLNYYGKIDMSFITETTQLTEKESIEALEGEMFYNPLTDTWEESGRFLAGNVIIKQKQILSATDKLSGEQKVLALKAADALEQVFPEKIEYELIDINMGERWISNEIYSNFASELFDVETVIHYFPVNDTFIVSLKAYSPIAYNVYSIRHLSGKDLFLHALQDTVPELKKEILKNGEYIKVPDEEAIQEASVKIQEIRQKFNEWLDCQSVEFKDELVRTYNERFNCYVRPSYDGSAQTFPNLCFEQFPFDDLYKSQKDAIWMIKQNNGGVCWHSVGTGKTMIMCVAAYEMKRLNLVQKPCIIGLKANVHELADTFRKAYPTAKLLYPGKEDFTPANRKEFFSKIKNQNWDCIIMTHDQFGKIPQSDDTVYRIYAKELQEVEESLNVIDKMNEAWSNKKLVKGLETRKDNLTAALQKLKAKLDEKKDEECLDFHSLGIDHLFIDESQVMKNLMFQTRHTRVAGIGNSTGSQRAMNLLIAIRDIQERTGKDLGATFLSGTVIVNALTELYVLFKYLRPNELAKQNITCFDAWAAIFTKKSTDYELSVTGNIKRKERFRTYIKVPELANFLREITDYRTAEMINLDIPDKNVIFLSSAPTADQEKMIERLMSFAATGNWFDLGLDKPAPEHLDQSKMLIATDIARKMALDMRMLSTNLFGDDPQNKASICASKVAEYYHKYNAQLGCQFIFSDLSTYKPNEWNIYADIKKKLVEIYHIPADEIQFIQTAKTEKARKSMIAKMNSGEIRVLFGSTTMLGTGVNAQKRAVAVHHLEVPWRPADLEQRNGRAVRKGNNVKLWGDNKVDVIIYGTEKSLDAYKFNLLRNKQLFINQINKGTIAVRRMDEDGIDENSGMNFAEFVAILSGNNDLLNKTKLDHKIMQLEKEQATFKREKNYAERVCNNLNKEIEVAENFMKMVKIDINYIAQVTDFSIHLNGREPMNEEDTGRHLQQINRNTRTEDFKQIGTADRMKLYVKSECNLSGGFDRNRFFIEAVSGFKYKCGKYGALPSAFADATNIIKTTAQDLEHYINNKLSEIERCKQQIAAMQTVLNKTWNKYEELNKLKAECSALQKKIDEDLKKTEQQAIAQSDAA